MFGGGGVVRTPRTAHAQRTRCMTAATNDNPPPGQNHPRSQPSFFAKVYRSVRVRTSHRGSDWGSSTGLCQFFSKNSLPVSVLGSEKGVLLAGGGLCPLYTRVDRPPTATDMHACVVQSLCSACLCHRLHYMATSYKPCSLFPLPFAHPSVPFYIFFM